MPRYLHHPITSLHYIINFGTLSLKYIVTLLLIYRHQSHPIISFLYYISWHLYHQFISLHHYISWYLTRPILSLCMRHLTRLYHSHHCPPTPKSPQLYHLSSLNPDIQSFHPHHCTSTPESPSHITSHYYTLAPKSPNRFKHITLPLHLNHQSSPLITIPRHLNHPIISHISLYPTFKSHPVTSPLISIPSHLNHPIILHT